MRPTLLFLALGLVPGAATAQHAADSRPFGVVAISAGAQGFARPPVTTGVIGAHAYVPAGPWLLGGYVADAVAERQRVRASVLMATVGLAQRRARGWQAYPYVGAGMATLRARHGTDRLGPAVTAGFGLDALLAAGGFGAVVGGRVGYVTRSFNDDESIAFAMVSFGAGGRVHDERQPAFANR